MTVSTEYRRAIVNQLVTGQFPIIDTDGYTRVSGLSTPNQIVVTVYKDGAIVSNPVTVTEIVGSGEYKFTFTPDSAGLWRVEFDVPSKTQRSYFDYDAVTADIGAIPGQNFTDRVTDGYGNGVQYATVNVYVAGTSTLLATAQTDYLGNYVIPLTGQLADPLLVDLQFIGTGIQTYTKTNIRLV